MSCAAGRIWLVAKRSALSASVPASLSYMTNERTGAQIPTGSGPMPANTSESISSRPVSEPGFA